MTGKKRTIPELVALRYDLAVDLYRQRAKALQSEAESTSGHSLPYFVYRLFGTDLMASIALCFNPSWQFDPEIRAYSNKKHSGLYGQTPVPANRLRRMLTIPAESISGVYTKRVDRVSTSRFWTGSTWIVITNPDVHTVTTTPFAGLSQLRVYGFIKDTSWKTRNPTMKTIPFDKASKVALNLQSQGECEIWKPYFTPTRGGCSWSSYTKNYTVSQPGVYSDTTYGFSTVFSGGPSASVDAADVNAAALAENLYAKQVMKRNANDMLAKSLPNRRSFDLFYQIGELKDLSQTLSGTVAIWRNIESIIGSANFVKSVIDPQFWTHKKFESIRAELARVNIILNLDKGLANAYLTYKFGYESLYRAAVQLMNSPKRITEEVNNLISHNGQNITLSSTRKFPIEAWTAPPNINCATPSGMLPDPLVPLSISGTREFSLRSIVNCGVRLPDLSVPILRRQLSSEKLGIVPRPTDIYNLIPWTWLFDWFTGLGSYLRIAEQVQDDRFLINWGMMSYNCTLTANASRGSFSEYTNLVVFSNNPSHPFSETQKAYFTSAGSFVGKYYLRLDLGTIADVNLTTGKGLSQTQWSIITALLPKLT